MSQESKPDKPKVALVRSLAKGEDVKTDTYIWRENASYNTFRTQYHHEHRYPNPEGNLHQTRAEKIKDEDDTPSHLRVRLPTSARQRGLFGATAT